MDALETLVRDTLVDRAADAPADHTLLDAVLHKPRRRRWPVIGLAAAVVAAVVTTVVIAMPQHSTPAGSGSDASTVVAAPSGYRWLTFSGVAIAVPVRLPLEMSACGLPARYVLEEPSVASGDASCIPPRSDPVLTIYLTSHPARRFGSRGHFATHPVTLHGLYGLVGYDRHRLSGGTAGQLVVADQRFGVTVHAPRAETVSTILRSARPAADLLGCATQLRPYRGPKVVPRDPLYADACVYSMRKQGVTRSLVAVRSVTGTTLDRLLQIDRRDVLRTGPVFASQRFVKLNLHYRARREVFLGFQSEEAARLITSP